jgi:hypothetical protein
MASCVSPARGHFAGLHVNRFDMPPLGVMFLLFADPPPSFSTPCNTLTTPTIGTHRIVDALDRSVQNRTKKHQTAINPFLNSSSIMNASTSQRSGCSSLVGWSATTVPISLHRWR